MGRWDSREATISSLSVVGVGHKTPKRNIREEGVDCGFRKISIKAVYMV